MKETSKHRKRDLYEHLRRGIMTLALAPGTDLDESSLSRDFELSRTPLREVFHRLEGEGLIDLRENRGARVAEMSHTMMRDFFLAAPMIYASVLRLAAKNATPEQIADLQAAQTTFRNALRYGTGADRTLANYRFHEITGDMAGNKYIRPSFQRLLIDHARIGMTFYQPRDDAMAQNLAKASQQHDAIIAAIADGNEEDASQLAIDHWNLSRHQIELFVMPDGLAVPLGATMNTTVG